MFIDMQNIPDEISMRVRLSVDDDGWVHLQKVSAGKEDQTLPGNVFLSTPLDIVFKEIQTSNQLRNGMIENLKSDIEKEKAESYVKTQHMEDKIKQLLCIEDKSNKD